MNGNDGDHPAPTSPVRLTMSRGADAGERREPSLPPGLSGLDDSHARGETFRVDGTNVVRVPFGVRQPRRRRPERPERWATLVLPFQAGGPSPTPPQAA